MYQIVRNKYSLFEFHMKAGPPWSSKIYPVRFCADNLYQI